MYKYSGKAASVALVAGCLWTGPTILAQQAKVAAVPKSELSPEKAISLAEQGRCRESISGLKRAMAGQVSAATRKQAGVLGVRCSLALDDRDSTLDFIRWLNKQFAQDPDALFVVVHAYSDLSTRAAQDLGRTAPQSLAAHKLNAEALEMQGKWEPAQLEYEEMIRKEPAARGTHFLLGRLLLSRPDAPQDATERAQQEFLKELQIDPNNGGAQYILGELARREEKWDEAISRFSQAAKLDPNFAEAYLGWGRVLSLRSRDTKRQLRPCARQSASRREIRKSTTRSRPHCKDPGTRKRQKRNLPFTRASVLRRQGHQCLTNQNSLVPSSCRCSHSKNLRVCLA